jgi:hypothetical protein
MPEPSHYSEKHKTYRAASLSLTVLTMSVLCIALLPAVGVSAFQVGLSALPVSFPVQSPDVAVYFKEMARQDDIASVSPENLGLVAASSNGQIMVAFRSWADAEQQLGSLSDQVDWVMYNPENWELTPGDEKQDLGTVVLGAAEFTHGLGLRFMFAPDRRFAERYLAQVGPSIDAVLLQGQRLQHEPQTFAKWVLEMVQVAREANPDMLVYVQVGATRGPAAEMYAAIQTVADQINGIAIWSMPRSLNVLEDFVEMLRVNPPVVEPSATATAAPPETTPTTTMDATPTPARTAVPTPTSSRPMPTATAEPSPTRMSTAIEATATRVRATLTPDPTPTGSAVVERTPALSLDERNERTRNLLRGTGLVVGGAAAGLLAGYWFFHTRKGTNG